MIKKFTYIKSLTFTITFFCAVTFGFGQTTLVAGDIAITGFNADNPDQFTFVLLTDVTATTEIKFTDNGWITIGGFRNTEGTVTWTATSDLTCGTEIIIEDTLANTYSATLGTATETDAPFSLAAGGDQILAYQGADLTPTFIYAVHFASATGWSDATSANTTAIPTGLTDGTNALYLGNFDNGNYNCTVTSNAALILADVSTTTNWTLNNTRIATLGGCTYTCAAICSGATVTWDGTVWDNGTGPDINTPAVLNGNYFTNLTNVNFSACSLTVNVGARLTVNNGDFVAVENDVTVNGELWVETQGAFVQNDAVGTFTGTGRVNKTTALKQDWFFYTYWSSPVESETVNGAFPNTDANRRFMFNAANYLDEHTFGTTNGIPDDIDDDGNDWQIVAGGDLLIPGVGYAATSSSFGFYPGTDSATFEGVFNTGDIFTSISFNVLNTLGSWNFIGNPYPCAIDFVAFQAANSTIIDGTAYFWSQATAPDAINPGNEASNFSQNDYATYAVGTGGAPGGGPLTPTQYIPSSQGFFIAGLGNGIATFTNTMRSTGNNDQFFRANPQSKSEANDINKLWVNLTSDNGVFSGILIGFVEGATNSDDGLMYDAPRNLSAGAASVLYTNIEGSNKKFVIQGKDVNSINTDEVITIGFKTTIDVPTIYTLSIAQLEGDFLNSNPIFLKDNLLNTLHNLKDSDYNFTSEVGEFNERFEIVFTEDALSLGDETLKNNTLSIIELQNGTVQFKLSGNTTMASIQIIDLQGRIIYNLQATGNTKTYNLSNLSQAPYIAKVTLVNGSIITKKAIKRF